jgi:choline dehydrogenase-like flavoprotein
VGSNVLRNRGERWGLEDAPVMPTIVSVNTNSAAIVIGEKAADLVIHPASDGRA